MRPTHLLAATAVAVATAGSAFATTVTDTGVNQAFILFDRSRSDVDLGDLNLAEAPISISAQVSGIRTVRGSLAFDAFADPGLPRGQGSLNVNIGNSGGSFTATFGGQTLDFEESNGDFTASLDYRFESDADTAEFLLSFQNLTRGDLIQLNVSPSPIPVPAGGLMLVGGLGAMVALRRRKAAAKT